MVIVKKIKSTNINLFIMILLIITNIKVLYGETIFSNSKNNEIIYKLSLENKLSMKSNYSFFDEDDYILALQIGTFLYLEYGLDRHTINNSTSSPNNLDLYIREYLIWNKKDIDKAEKISDILLYGAFIGSIPVTPFIKKNGPLL